MRKVQISAQVPPELLAKLEELAKSQGRSLSNMIVMLLEASIAKKGRAA